MAILRRLAATEQRSRATRKNPTVLPTTNLRAVRAETGRGNSALDQRILTQTMADGHFAQHTRRMERIYRDKSLRAQQVIQAAYSAHSRCSAPMAGSTSSCACPAAWTDCVSSMPAVATV